MDGYIITLITPNCLIKDEHRETATDQNGYLTTPTMAHLTVCRLREQP